MTWGRLVFDAMASDVSDLASDDIKKLWKPLERMLGAPPGPFTNFPRAAWTIFDHLCALVRDPALLGGNSQTVEILQPLEVLDTIEEVEHMRPPTDGRAEGTRKDNRTRPDGSLAADPNTPQPAGPPGSSKRKQVDVTVPGLETGGPMDPRASPPVPGPTPLTKWIKWRSTCPLWPDPNLLVNFDLVMITVL